MSSQWTNYARMVANIQDPEVARLAALSALRGWALRRDRLAGDRAGLL